ncbi:MAG: hypothetical protein NWR64_00385, partial [Haliea sp.]|nr:hypothetical protein [Haliea sp.]
MSGKASVPAVSPKPGSAGLPALPGLLVAGAEGVLGAGAEGLLGEPWLPLLLGEEGGMLGVVVAGACVGLLALGQPASNKHTATQLAPR